MDIVTRTLLLIAIGSLAVLVIYWFAGLVYLHAAGGQLVIAPFRIVGPNADTSGYGESLAVMLKNRLAKIQSDLRSGTGGTQLAGGSKVKPLIITQPVDIPAELRRSVDLQISVGGVQVGGMLAWLHEKLFENKTLTFTLVERVDGSVVSADLGALVTRGDPHLWLELTGDPGAIASNVAYALIQRKFAEQGAANLAALNLADFRLVVDSLAAVERLNEKARQKHLVDKQFTKLLAPLEELHDRVPRWHALTYLMGNIAESSGNRQKALFYYLSLQHDAAEKGGASPSIERELASLVTERLEELGEVTPSSETVKEAEFIAAAREFARMMGLPGPDVNIAFRRFDIAGQQGQWNAETRTYEVNIDHVETNGLPQYVALTGRFMNTNFDRCFGEGALGDPAGRQFWNEFRYSVVDYLIHSVPEFSEVQIFSQRFAFFRVLNRLEEAVGKEPVKRIALELLARYECDWSQDNIEERMRAIVEERGLAPPEAVVRAFEVPESDTPA